MDFQHFSFLSSPIFFLGLSENIVYPKKPNGFADHYPYEKWLFHWGYPPFFFGSNNTPVASRRGASSGAETARPSTVSSKRPANFANKLSLGPHQEYEVAFNMVIYGNIWTYVVICGNIWYLL